MKPLIGRILYKYGGPVALPIFLKDTKRTRIVLLSQGKILLVKGWISSQRWTLPGGGEKSGEGLRNCAEREVLEETSLHIDPKALHKLGEVEGVSKRVSFRAHYYAVEIAKPDSIMQTAFDIIDAAWFDMAMLPQPLHPDVEVGLRLWREYDGRNRDSMNNRL